jgi:hypothetical protein
MALITIQGMAQDRQREKRHQERKERMERFEEFTAEEMAELKTKKMTLDLHLNQSQQDRIHTLNLKQAKERKERMEQRKKHKANEGEARPSKEERLRRMHARLDQQIAINKQMKDILNEEQYDKWSAKRSRHHNRKRAMHKRKRKE